MHSFLTVQIISAFLPPDFTCPRRQGNHFSKAVTGFRRVVGEQLAVGVGGSQLKV